MKRPALSILTGPILTGPTLTAFVVLGIMAAAADNGAAQCSTCPTPVVAYSPVSTVTYTPYTGWYPGKLLDQWRMRRYGYTAPTAVTATYAPYTASYAPYTASYAPYTASYAPATYTAAYTPYTASYVPTTSNYITAYAPLGQRQVLMRPVVVESPVVSTGCTTCAYSEPCDPCSSCSACPTGVTSATYSTPACSTCATGTSTYGTPDYGTTSGGGLESPSLSPQEAAPLRSDYPPLEQEPTTPPTPGPKTETNSYYDFDAPALLNPSDRTARRSVGRPIQRGASVDVVNAVYRKPAASRSTGVQPTSATTNDAADGWSSIPAGR